MELTILLKSSIYDKNMMDSKKKIENYKNKGIQGKILVPFQ